MRPDLGSEHGSESVRNSTERYGTVRYGMVQVSKSGRRTGMVELRDGAGLEIGTRIAQEWHPIERPRKASETAHNA